MSDGHTVILRSSRETAHRIVDAAPEGSILTVKPPRRTLEQNARLWAMLTDISLARPEGRELTPDVWKALFMHALDHTQRFEMALDGMGYVPLGFRSSRMTKDQMNALFEVIHAYAARHDIVLRDWG